MTEKAKAYHRAWYYKNHAKMLISRAKQYANHKEKKSIDAAYKKGFNAAYRQYARKWRKANPDYEKRRYQKRRDGMLAQKKKYFKDNRFKIIESRRRRYQNDPTARLVRLARTRINSALRGKIKVGRTFELIGCSVEVLKAHLEAQFKPGMAWENYGLWQVDHIHPCAAFDFSQPEQQKACFHYSNLQPLWASENLSKGAKILHYLDR